MNKTKRARARESAEQADLKRKQQRDSAQKLAAEKQREISQILATKRDPFASESGFMRAVAAKAPKLLDQERSVFALQQMAKVAAHRSVEQWQPKGKGYQALLLSLANHLFAIYPMPAFCWSVFWDGSSLALAKLINRVACGSSLFALTSDQAFSVNLTKKQCHRLMSMPARYGFVEAIRYVQVMSAGGNQAIYHQWCRSQYTRTLQSADMEIFWQQVLVWVCRQTELSPGSIVPLMDYLAYRKHQEPYFKMKGRRLKNLYQAMLDWQHLEKLRKQAMGFNLPSSGWFNAHWQQSRLNKGKKKVEKLHWQMTEILSDRRLLDEGRTLNHCVYVYRRAISKGRCSIWSLSCNKKPRLTIEVNNRYKLVVQVKGKSNREPEHHEWQAVRRWASLNGLTCR